MYVCCRLFNQNGFGSGGKVYPCQKNDVMGCGVILDASVKYTEYGTPSKNQTLRVFFTKNGAVVRYDIHCSKTIIVEAQGY